jgi:hypothetical protein
MPRRRPRGRLIANYLSVKLDDPGFAATIYASLVKGEGDDDSYTLIRSAATAPDPPESNGHVLFGTGVQVRTRRSSYADLSFESACCGAVRLMTVAARHQARSRIFDSCGQRARTALTVRPCRSLGGVAICMRFRSSIRLQLLCASGVIAGRAAGSAVIGPPIKSAP